MATEVENGAHFIGRCAGYPVVASALQQVTCLYGKTKETNSLMKYTLETAESGVKIVANTAMPMVSKFEKPIGSLDSFACGQLDKLEKTYPTITKPTEQVLEEGQQVYNKNVKPMVDKISGAYQYGVEKVTEVKDYGTSKVGAVKNYTQASMDSVMQYSLNKINDTTIMMKESVNTALQSPTGQKVLGGVNNVVDTAEGYMEKYLPEEKMEGEEKDETIEADCEEKEPATETLKRVTSLTDKMRRRMFTRAMKDMRNLQIRSQETIQKLNFTVNLMDYARDHIDNAKAKVGDGYEATKDRLNFYWAELNKAEEEMEMEDEKAEEQKTAVTPTALELRALATARHLSLQLKQAMSTTAEHVKQALPESVYQQIQAVKTYTEDLYSQFSKAESLKELPQTFVAQTKEKLASVQETLALVMETYNPLTWVFPTEKENLDLLFEEEEDLVNKDQLGYGGYVPHQVK